MSDHLTDEDTREMKLKKAQAISQMMDRLRADPNPTHETVRQLQWLERERKFLTGSMPLTLAHERKED